MAYEVGWDWNNYFIWDMKKLGVVDLKGKARVFPMNAAALNRLKIISGTATELTQVIKDSAMKQRLPGHLETAIYKSADEADELLTLSLWQSLDNLSSMETQLTLPVNRVIFSKAKLVSRDIFKMIKDYQLITAQPVFSHLVLFTIPTTNPQIWINDGVKALSRNIKDWSGLVRVWLGRSINEPQDTLILLLRMDWLSQQEQQIFMVRPLTTAFLEQLHSEGGIIQFGSLSLHEKLQLTE